MRDMDPQVPALDVLITETLDLTDPQAGGIHKGDYSLLLDVRHGRDELYDLVLWRDIWEIGVEPAHGDLHRVPGLMKNVHREKSDLGKRAVDCPVRETAFFLQAV